MPPRIAALIVAAGRGSRAGGDVPKQYAALSGDADTVLGRAVDAFLNAPLVDSVRVVIHPDDADLYRRAMGARALPDPVTGGATRQQSVLIGLESLAEAPPELVLIHDAARPFVNRETIASVIGALALDAGAIAAVPVADTLKRADPASCVAGTIDRAGLWQAQTPQGFRFAQILAAHRAAAGYPTGVRMTDDAAVAEAAGLAVRLVPDRRDNFKVTTADDLARARALTAGGPAPPDLRCGHGFDTHRLVRDAARPLMLCGIEVPGELALAGHSDADVGLHALTDALLGALAQGDIGEHFPPTDPRWRGAPSATFLCHAADLARAEGFAIAHADVTLICERPRIGPHRDTMRGVIARMLGIDPARVSVKASTTEQLGFAGRGEGIAALATATLVRAPHRPRTDG